MDQNIHSFWSIAVADLCKMLNIKGDGLSSTEAENRRPRESGLPSGFGGYPS